MCNRCPNLTHLDIPVQRALGGAREVQQYQYLERLTLWLNVVGEDVPGTWQVDMLPDDKSREVSGGHFDQRCHGRRCCQVYFSPREQMRRGNIFGYTTSWLVAVISRLSRDGSGTCQNWTMGKRQPAICHIMSHHVTSPRRIGIILGSSTEYSILGETVMITIIRLLSRNHALLYYSRRHDDLLQKRRSRRGLGHYDGREACAAEGCLARARARAPSCFLVHGGFRSRPCGLPRFLGHGVGLALYRML